jgi:hypothetical protein
VLVVLPAAGGKLPRASNYDTFYNYDTFAADLDIVLNTLSLIGVSSEHDRAIADNTGRRQGSRASHPFPAIEISPCLDNFRVVLARPVA